MSDTLNTVLAKNGSHFLHANVRSIRNKIDEIQLRFSNSNVKILTVSESWLKEGDDQKLYNIPGFKLLRLDRTWKARLNDDQPKTGGGLCMYVREDTEYSEYDLNHLNKSSKNIEIQCVTLQETNAKETVKCNVYRPPKGQVDIFVEELETLVGDVLAGNNKNRNVYVMGDCNIDLLDTQDWANGKDLENMLLQYGLDCKIKQPTRLSDWPRCLDVIFTNDDNVVSKGVIQSDLSNHDKVYITCDKEIKTREKVSFKGRAMKSYTDEKLKTALYDANWGDYYNSDDPTFLWTTIENLLVKILDEMCPVRTFRVREAKQEWDTEALLQQINDKDRLLARARKTKRQVDKDVAKAARKQLNKDVRTAKQNHIRTYWWQIKTINKNSGRK